VCYPPTHPSIIAVLFNKLSLDPQGQLGDQINSSDPFGRHLPEGGRTPLFLRDILSFLLLLLGDILISSRISLYLFQDLPLLPSPLLHGYLLSYQITPPYLSRDGWVTPTCPKVTLVSTTLICLLQVIPITLTSHPYYLHLQTNSDAAIHGS
jgi:hypothetical protein